MIDYIRRYLNDPEQVPNVHIVATVSSTSVVDNALVTYIRRYLAD